MKLALSVLLVFGSLANAELTAGGDPHQDKANHLTEAEVASPCPTCPGGVQNRMRVDDPVKPVQIALDQTSAPTGKAAAPATETGAQPEEKPTSNAPRSE